MLIFPLFLEICLKVAGLKSLHNLDFSCCILTLLLFPQRLYSESVLIIFNILLYLLLILIILFFNVNYDYFEIVQLVLVLNTLSIKYLDFTVSVILCHCDHSLVCLFLVFVFGFSHLCSLCFGKK